MPTPQPAKNGLTSTKNHFSLKKFDICSFKLSSKGTTNTGHKLLFTKIRNMSQLEMQNQNAKNIKRGNEDFNEDHEYNNYILANNIVNMT